MRSSRRARAASAGEPPSEGGRDGVADGHQHAVAGAEGEMSEDGLRLVREQELQRVDDRRAPRPR